MLRTILNKNTLQQEGINNKLKTKIMKNSVETKDHYRKAFKSDHLGVADIEEFIEEGKPLIYHIQKVAYEQNVKVAGKKGNHNIAYFKEGIKPLVLNVKNSKIVKSFNNESPFVQDWINTIVELYIDPNVTFGKEKTGGVRIRPSQPKLKKPELTPEHARWEEAKKAIKEGKREGVLKIYSISEENLKLIEI